MTELVPLLYPPALPQVVQQTVPRRPVAMLNRGTQQPQGESVGSKTQ